MIKHFCDRCGAEMAQFKIGAVTVDDRPCPFRQEGPIQAFRRWYKDDRRS
jgi:hypothetical protein